MSPEGIEVPVSLRMTAAQAKELERLSALTGRSVSDLIREAITAFILSWKTNDAPKVD